jgi:hypothetical protein
MVSRFTYGEKLVGEMGDDLIKWNLEMLELVNEALFKVWLVNFIPSCEFFLAFSAIRLIEVSTYSALYSRLGPWNTV